MQAIQEPGHDSEGGWPLLRLGFRPFYLLAAAFAVVAIPLWLASYYGLLPASHLNLLWHMHEMVFGFGMAVVIGFLFTAARNWTGLWTPRRGGLAGFALLWLAGRLAMASGPGYIAALLDLAFVPAAAWVLLRVMQRSGKTRNIPLLGILALISLCNLGYHLAALQLIGLDGATMLQAALLLIVLLATVMGARVIPGFTANATLSKTSGHPRLDGLAFAAIASCFASALLHAPGALVLTLSIIGSLAHFARMVHWGLRHTARHPLLWILHLAFCWMGIGVLLLGIAAWQQASTSSAFHAMAVGGMASLIVGMIARTTRGHTGQKMQAGRADLCMFAAIQAAALLRLCANLGHPQLRSTILALSAACWCLAFLAYLCAYAPALFRPRADGRAG